MTINQSWYGEDKTCLLLLWLLLFLFWMMMLLWLFLSMLLLLLLGCKGKLGFSMIIFWGRKVEIQIQIQHIPFLSGVIFFWFQSQRGEGEYGGGGGGSDRSAVASHVASQCLS